MPPKRRAATAAAAPPPPSKASTLPSQRRSKLARENDLSAAQETEIREAFSLFALPAPAAEASPSSRPEGVLKTGDVRRCLIALGLTVPRSEVPAMLEALDPEQDGFVLFEHFVAYAAILIHERAAAEDEEEDADDGGASAGLGARRRREEVESAFGLFTQGAGGPITVQHLRRVARELREEVADDVLRDMIVEANGEVNTSAGVGKGVSLEEFEGVMRRAGVFG
ncbi:uncharacterized protein K452DRAFT_328559 [Aplosporella prunicola CBS 121167]|uniref:Calmodulin n=1 Tax=Aplosporella prunicola CBS 121167 TaxID=1176127 RepID=A0A6A6B3X7_9PEZI|nr:uncharacterized protein K452DRAFT_328559 [Aplosporella prunicola CBS 121167]KAF2138770.1 hypothetical protein K452DRAFT_328559 [Aplosporella prunicola CBS 121167]